ncbi:junctional cadherin 5-associated protein [Pantherophis guttatus]|uniref:Junctional protein associated with coronary artery disease n=1 Tax=Pantherophis guttatus TaxID=94885 RepID=A0A6P9AJ10_PANGU|nr:junctional cadherin 5-associated protein [Pantherophis guttatus]XP_034258511.1 junctional cadherin 5-associated protein [Pantherophis guttatus]XP_034258512.1 junctional cadherin 5-associated protein [Pantherophis guttatus]
MFSVDDLLISHGYKQSKNPTNSSEVAGDQHEDTGRRSDQATRNGLPIHPGAIPKTNKARRYQNDNENNPVGRGRPRNTHQEYFSGPGNMQGELYDQSLSRSSPSKKENDFASWRRQCQDFSAYDYPDRVDKEMRGMGAACALFGDENKVHWGTEEGLENMRSNKQEAMKLPGDYRRQSLKTDTWKQPTVFGRREPDTDNKKRPLQIVYSGRQNIAASHVKNKPQSFPIFISSENSNYAEIPAVASSKQYKVKPELESLKYFEPTARPKYGRPLKPPSYEFHQQSRGIVETNPPQDEQQTRKTTFYVTKVEDQDPTLGPPLYIPPPSYKSGQQSKNQHVPEEVPDYDESFVKETQVLDQGICISSGSSVNQLQMEDEEPILFSETQVRCQEKQLSSVQYIPFDDPRIRHIKIIHPADLHQMEDQAEDANNSSVFHKNSVDKELSNLNVDVPDSINIAVKSNQVSDRSRWLVESNADQDSGVLSTQRGSYDTGISLNGAYAKARPSAQSPGATDLSTETFTKVKTFEPGIEIQGKNHLKKKTNETMFCLVSISAESELNMPAFDRNNNAIQGSSEKYDTDSNRDLKEQSFLSMSSTDLELQALTGNMLNKTVLEKQDFQRPEFKQMNYVSSKQPPKHKELEYSGSWPCTTYKDQETQTSFREESQIQQPLHGSQQPLHGLQLKKSNTLTNGHFLKYGSSTTESAPSSLPTDNRKDRPIPPPRKTQFNKSSKLECPRTVVHSKTGQNESRTTSTGLPGQKNEPSFARKEENKSPCSIKEAFGQFLLKPVSRRPWDAISELESINKEIQKQEERNVDNKENEQKQEREEDKKVNKAEGKACRADEVSQDHGCSAEARKVKPATSVFKKGTNKSKPESENASKISNTRVVFSDLRNVRSEAREMDKSVKEKKENGLNQRQDNARKIIKQAISLHPMKSNVSGHSDSKNSKPLNNINSREASVENHKNKDSDQLKKAAGRNSPASKIASVASLSFKRRNQGCSEPNLRSVVLDVNEGTSIPDSSTKKVSSNESLHARASRILGIEVAVESLTVDNKTLPAKDCGSNNMAQSRELSNTRIPRAEKKTNVASSKGKPKSGWSKSTFIGESNLGSVKDQCSSEEKLTREQYFQQHPDLGKHQEDHAPSLESAVLPLAERKSLPSNVERKTESTSKVTVPRQGKVASAVNRAAMDRIARMKEVDSVSRMRRLTIKNAGSGEDRDEDKQFKEPEGKANDSAVGSTEFPHKLSQGSCVSKRIISLNENERLGNRNTKKNGRDLPSSEVYDPSQVERV